MTQSQVKCRNPDGCTGVIGAWSGGSFFPAAHLRPTRDLWLSSDGVAHIRCAHCGAWHSIRRGKDGRLIMNLVVGPPPQ